MLHESAFRDRDIHLGLNTDAGLGMLWDHFGQSMFALGINSLPFNQAIEDLFEGRRRFKRAVDHDQLNSVPINTV